MVLKALHQEELIVLDNLGVGVAAVSALLKWRKIILNLFLLFRYTTEPKIMTETRKLFT